MLIASGNLTQKILVGQVALVTGAGRGIGYEAARSLLWLGAQVILAEIDKTAGRAAEEKLAAEFGPDRACFVHTDVSKERDIERLKRSVQKVFGPVDIVLNNATITPMGAVQDVPIADWDASYGVNLRGPVLLARAFLPGMLRRNRGAFVLVSSVGQAYMGAYECFKAAQVHLGDTLDAELEESHVCAFTIGPGLVHTPGAAQGIARLAPMYGKSVEEFYAMSAEHIIPVEAAGAGFAAAIALAQQFRGQEISAKQALIAAGIDLDEFGPRQQPGWSPDQISQALSLCQSVRKTLSEQSQGWQERPLFERQWMLRDFRKNAGLPIEGWLETLERLEAALVDGDAAAVQAVRAPLGQLAAYYQHMQKLAQGYEKDKQKLAHNLAIIENWRLEAQNLADLLSSD